MYHGKDADFLTDHFIGQNEGRPVNNKLPRPNHAPGTPYFRKRRQQERCLKGQPRLPLCGLRTVQSDVGVMLGQLRLGPLGPLDDQEARFFVRV